MSFTSDDTICDKPMNQRIMNMVVKNILDEIQRMKTEQNQAVSPTKSSPSISNRPASASSDSQADSSQQTQESSQQSGKQKQE